MVPRGFEFGGQKRIDCSADDRYRYEGTEMLMRAGKKRFGAAEFEQFWRAVRLRDSRFDGAFVYAVRSTGVYCLASCPARRPKRDRVLFLSSAIEAENQGFRACKRCWT